MYNVTEIEWFERFKTHQFFENKQIFVNVMHVFSIWLLNMTKRDLIDVWTFSVIPVIQRQLLMNWIEQFDSGNHIMSKCTDTCLLNNVTFVTQKMR